MIDDAILTIPGMIIGGVLLATAGGLEWWNNRIPNWLVMPGLLAGLALIAYDGQWLAHLGGLGIGILIAMPLFLLGGLGAGATKILMAIGAILGGLSVICTVPASIVLAPIFAMHIARQERIVREQIHKAVAGAAAGDAEGALRPPRVRRTMPMIPAVIIGTVTAVLFQLWYAGRL